MTDWVDVGATVGVALITAATALRVASRGKDLAEVSALIEAASSAKGNELASARHTLANAANHLAEDMRAARHSKFVFADIAYGLIVLFGGVILAYFGFANPNGVAWFPLIAGIFAVVVAIVALIADTRSSKRRSPWAPPAESEGDRTLRDLADAIASLEQQIADVRGEYRELAQRTARALNSSGDQTAAETLAAVLYEIEAMSASTRALERQHTAAVDAAARLDSTRRRVR